MVATESSPARPFPLRAMLTIASVWMAVDAVIVVLIILRVHDAILQSRPLFLNAAAAIWFSTLAAKYLLVLGWIVLGEGRFRQRLASLLVFLPLLVPLVILPVVAGAGADAGFLCSSIMVLLMITPACYFFALTYLLLYVNDHRLRRDAAASQPHARQFTVRQIMAATLAAALVLSGLRWVQDSNLEVLAVGLQMPLLAWFLPMAVLYGLLLPQIYPGVLFAGGATLFALALPFAMLPSPQSGELSLWVSSYVVFYVAHVLLLRSLDYRLLRVPKLSRVTGEVRFSSPQEESGREGTAEPQVQESP